MAVSQKRGENQMYKAMKCNTYNIDLICMLLEHGADVNTRTTASWTPLLMAAKNRSTEVVRTLLEYGANVRMVDE